MRAVKADANWDLLSRQRLPHPFRRVDPVEPDHERQTHEFRPILV